MTYLLILALLVLLEVAYIHIARRLKIIDKANQRCSHTSAVPRGGGIIFLLGVWLYAAIFGMSYPWFVLGLSLAGIVSFVDDVRSLPVTLRLVVQSVAILMMFYQFGILNSHDWKIVTIALFVCVGILNAYNFMDGINGITGGYSLSVLLPLIYLNVTDNFISQSYLYIVGLSLLVFCFFNYRNKAICFAGDVGSISMAFILLFPLGLLILKTRDVAYLTLLAVYGVDVVLTICHRILLRENLAKAHRKHVYQLMTNELKMPHLAVSCIYMLLQLTVSAGLIFIPVNHYLYMGIVIAVLALAYILFMNSYYHLRKKRLG